MCPIKLKHILKIVSNLKTKLKIMCGFRMSFALSINLKKLNLYYFVVCENKPVEDDTIIINSRRVV